MPDKPNRVSIVISPRERFGAARESLANVLAETPQPFQLIYVSGRSPAKLLEHIDAQASEHGFDHIKIDRMLAPNESRNIGAAAATGEYIIFLDNDVFCQPGWLEPLLDCADETGAEVVAPLTCHGYPLHTTVHQAGGEFAPDPAAFFAQPVGQREIVEVMEHQDKKVADLTLERRETQLCEYHAVLVRRSVFERLGPLDEGMMATKEHLDLCMGVIQSGGKVVFEPKSVVTYLFPNRHSPITVEDWPFFLVRWSPQWQLRSLKRFQEKWGLKDDGYMKRRQASLEWRHRAGIVRPLVRKVPGLRQSTLFERVAGRVLSPFFRRATQMLVSREDRRRQDPATGLRDHPPSAPGRPA